MSYDKTVWQDNVTPANATNMNKIENELESLSSRADSVDSSLADVLHQTTVLDSANTFAFDISQRKSFTAEILDANLKVMVFNNIPVGLDFASPVTVKLVCTSGINISTYPIGTVWQDGVAPLLNTGKTYYLTFIRTGTGWHGMWAGEF